MCYSLIMANTKHSPEIKLAAARRELDLALMECPHWDFEGEGDGHCECCYRVDDAKRAVRAAKAACEAGRMVAL